MYGKVMSLPDKVMPVYARLATDWTPEKVNAFIKGLETGSLHPRDAKMKLAHAITTVFYGQEAADKAQENFIVVFQKGDLPKDMPEYQLSGQENIVEILVKNNLAKSRSQARRLIEQQGVKIDGETVTDVNLVVDRSCILQCGKRHYLRIKM
jgi:tyrosyl-tRNA synthetase